MNIGYLSGASIVSQQRLGPTYGNVEVPPLHQSNLPRLQRLR